MATYVISDIHGYLSRMFDVLEKANFDWNNDELYILGDIIDRGPESADMIEWAMEEAPHNIHFLLGNHEDLAEQGFRAVQDQGNSLDYIWDNPWSWNGGDRTLDECRELRGSNWCHKIADWISKLPLYYTLEVNGKSILLVHAGIIKQRRLSDDYNFNGRDEWVNIPKIGKVWSQHLLWARDRWFFNLESIPYDVVVFGHSPTSVCWWDDLKLSTPIEVRGKSGDIVRLTANVAGYGIRYCIDTGRRRMGLLRLDDFAEFYSDFEIAEDIDE